MNAGSLYVDMVGMVRCLDVEVVNTGLTLEMHRVGVEV